MKIKMMFDSSCGYSKEEIEKLGASFVPIIITVDGNEYLDGVNIDENKVLDLLNEGNHKFKTASVTLGSIKEEFDNILKDYDALIYLPISKGLSSTYNNALMVSKRDEYKDKVFVIDSLYATPWTYLYVETMIERAKKAKNPLKLKEEIESWINETIVFMALGSLYHAMKSGRVSKAEYIAGSLLKVVPIIAGYKGSISEEKHGLKNSKTRGIEKAFSKMEILVDEWKKKFEENDEYKYEYIYYSYGKNKDKFLSLLDKYENKKETKVGGSVLVHTGAELYGLGLKKIVK